MRIVGTVAAFALAVVGFGFVQQQFFPDSTRPELMVDLKLSEGASLTATQTQVEKLEAWLAKRPELENCVSYARLRRAAGFLPAAGPAVAAGQFCRIRAAVEKPEAT